MYSYFTWMVNKMVILFWSSLDYLVDLDDFEGMKGFTENYGEFCCILNGFGYAVSTRIIFDDFECY